MNQVDHASRADLNEAAEMMRRVLEQDFGGYRPHLHADLDDLAGAYLDQPGHALFVARADGRLVGSAGVVPCCLRPAYNAAWLVERYRRAGVCELVRVWVDASGRRQGVARALVGRAVAWAVDEAGYDTVYLHTNASVPGAEAFWRAIPTVEVHDARPDPFHTVHFEVEVGKMLEMTR